MTTVLVIIHIVACLSLILVVLLQAGKGASLGAAFGGASQTMFGGAGATTFLAKMTTVVALVFLLSCLGLAMSFGRGAPSSIMDQGAAPAATAPVSEAPQAPAEAPK
jgi:preprotein translocase subunit SecG